MGRLIGALIAAAFIYGSWYVRRLRGRSRMREIDEGKRCIACDGTSLDTQNNVARCLRCGHSVSLAGLQAAVVSDAELKDITRPEDRRRY